MYQIEIPPHINDVKLEMKRTKLNELIFRRLRYPINQFRYPITILRKIYDKIGENVIILYHDDVPYI
jgi:hypothetical protein